MGFLDASVFVFFVAMMSISHQKFLFFEKLIFVVVSPFFSLFRSFTPLHRQRLATQNQVVHHLHPHVDLICFCRLCWSYSSSSIMTGKNPNLFSETFLLFLAFSLYCCQHHSHPCSEQNHLFVLYFQFIPPKFFVFLQLFFTFFSNHMFKIHFFSFFHEKIFIAKKLIKKLFGSSLVFISFL